ncbi:hypothetical protein G6F58_012928 [Rhizopus delemar]|nr:hypothetical protein G6F58_012928 [Rhizopus delemar]
MRLDNALDGVRSVDSRATIIPGDPFRYGFPSGPYGRSNSIQQTLFGVNGELTKRLGGASGSQLWTVGGEWYGNKTEQNSSGYDNCPVLRPGTPAPTNSASATAATRSCRPCATTTTSKSRSPPPATKAIPTPAPCRRPTAAVASRRSCWAPGKRWSS